MSMQVSNLIPTPEILQLSQPRRKKLRPVRVLHLIEATLGGTLAYLDAMITASIGLPFEFGLAYATKRATPALEPALRKARAGGWQTFQLEMVREISARDDLRSLLRILALYRRFRPDIVHCHSSKAGALGRIAGLLSAPRCPRIVYAPHAVAAHLGRKYLLAEKILAPLTSRMIPVTGSERDQLVSLGLASRERCQVIAPVVECSEFAVRDRSDARLELGLPMDVPIVAAVGRLTAQKGPFAFLSVMQQVLKSFPEAHGIWVGDGELHKEFYRLARESGVADHVTVTGWQDDVRPWLAAADVLLSTSEYESFGYMVAEALAMERPVVATNVTGTCDIMRGELSSYLYPPGDAARAAELIGSLLRDPALSHRCGRAGRKQMEECFSSAAMHTSMACLYSTLASRSRKPEGVTTYARRA